MHDIKRFFGRNDVYRICLIFAVLIKLALYLHYFQFEGDKLFQALGARNLVDGNGLTFQQVLPGDLSQISFEPLNRWPPGYSLLITPFYLLTRSLETSSIIIDIISIILFFAVLHHLLRGLMFPQYLVSFLILLNGVAFAPYIAKPTDLLANVFILYTCYLSLNFFSDALRPARYGYMIGAVNILPVLLRYMYLPCLLAVPVVLIWASYLKNDRRIRTGGINSLVMSMVLAGGMLLIQLIYTGSGSYIFLSGKGFYPGNLLLMHPFVLSAFIDINFIQQQVSLISGVSYEVLFNGLKIVNAFILITLVIVFIRYVSQKNRESLTKWVFFVVSTGVISLSILLMLCYLSVTHNQGSRFFTSRLRWTFLEEERFFTFNMTVLPIIAGYYLFVYPRLKFRNQKVLQYLFAGLIFFQVIHTFYFLGKRFEPLALKGGNVLLTAEVKEYLKNRIVEIRKKDWDVVLTGNDETVSNWAALIGEKGILHPGVLIYDKITTRKTTVILIVLEKQMLPVFNDMLKAPNARLEKQIGHLYFFANTIHVGEITMAQKLLVK